MKLRLHGTVDEVLAMVDALTSSATVEVRSVSRYYPDRAPSALMRVYVDAVPATRLNVSERTVRRHRASNSVDKTAGKPRNGVAGPGGMHQLAEISP